MTAEHGSYQVGSVEVEAEVVLAEGQPLVELVRELGVPIEEAAAMGAPVEGWRVLQPQSGHLTIGAPVSDDQQVWRLAHVSPPTGGEQALIQFDPESAQLRPASSERRRGLELRWPPMLTRSDSGAVELDDDSGLAIDIVNVGDVTWKPDGDGFHVVGVVVPSGATGFSFGWTSYGPGRGRAVALDPGEYARVPVAIDSGSWARLEPGRHDLRAVLVDLNLPAATPLPVEISAATIARHRQPPREWDITPEARRRQTEQEVRRLTTQLAAAEALPPLIEALGTATTRREALSIIARILEGDDAGAEPVWMSSLSELLPLAVPTLRSRLDELAAHDDGPPAAGHGKDTSCL